MKSPGYAKKFTNFEPNVPQPVLDHGAPAVAALRPWNRDLNGDHPPAPARELGAKGPRGGDVVFLRPRDRATAAQLAVARALEAPHGLVRTMLHQQSPNLFRCRAKPRSPR
jgi:hypothetical protein